ncbi:recombination protein RecR [Spirochaetota bacterium]|nr:recombination protein RecR [Spirochaetota bacterium]
MASSFKIACDAFSKLPGVGRRSAERFVFYLLSHKKDNQAIVEALKQVYENTTSCPICGLYSEHSPCKICSSSKRDQDIICVVKTAHDAFRIERSGAFNGLYHVLGGLLSPFNDIYEKDLTLDMLAKRIKNTTREIFIAFEDTIEGEATASLLCERLQNEQGIVFTRMAVGIPLGAGLEHVDSETLKLSLAKRTPLAKTDKPPSSLTSY